MRKYLLTLAFSGFIFAFAKAQSADDLKPETIFHDFETGELYSWEQYPYAQDIGFDALFFARRTPTLNNSKYALAHPHRAYDTHELFQGFTRRINLVASADAQLETYLFLHSDRNAKQLEISLGTKDGQRYFYYRNAPKANEWIPVKVPLSAFRNDKGSLPVNSELEAITIQVNYDTIYYLNTYTILMDNFKLTGARYRRLIPDHANNFYFDAFNKTVVTTTSDPKKPFQLALKVEDDQALLQLNGKLYAPDGRLVNAKLAFKKEGNRWVSAAPLPDKAGTPGIWRLDVTATGANGSSWTNQIDLIVKRPVVKGHPRIFFTPETIAARKKSGLADRAQHILEKALKDSSYLKIPLESITEGIDRTGENLVGGPYAQNSVGFDAYGKWLRPTSQLRSIIETTAFRYALTGDQKAGQIGKEALLKFSRFSKWNFDWMLNRKFWSYYPVGYMIKSVALGYDMLYDLMTEEERKEVRTAMLEKGIKLFYRDMVEMNRMPSNLTNHISVLVSGMGLAAAAMYGDDPSLPDQDKYLAGILTKTRAFIDNTYYEDGSYGEPKTGYMDMATRDLAEWIAGLDNVFGIDLSNTTAVENYYKYPLQASFSDGLIHSYGDGGRKYYGFTQEHSEWFVHKKGNPFIYKFVKPYWDAGNGGFLGYLWYRDDIKPRDRSELPESKTFSAQGMVMRSGWGDDATVITTRVGPHSNHYHFDQGSFQIMKNGEELLTDPGIGPGGYYANLEFLSYYTQSIGHNVLLVDHDPGSQIAAHFDNGIKSLSTWPTMKNVFNGKHIDAVTSNLESVYKGKLARYERNLIYRKNGPVFLWDHVVSAKGQKHVFDWLFHVPATGEERKCVYENNRFLVNMPKARLTMDVINDLPLKSSIRDKNAKTSTFDKADYYAFSESFLTLSTDKALDSADFLAVMLPESINGAAPQALAPTETLKGNGWKAARLKSGGEEDVFYHRTGGAGLLSMGEVETDAQMLLVSRGQFGQLYHLSGQKLNASNWNVEAGSPVSMTALTNGNSRSLELESPAATTVRIKVSGKPAIKLNGKPLPKAVIKDGWFELQVQAGKTTIEYEQH
jgi:hypothetical protein